ncbi:hypothetical protein C8R47DRAFT_1323573 [Mycena vitilis]|nr:hypothetical protein C8R47DRAFT_1323573 [Mycena vitilis]
MADFYPSDSFARTGRKSSCTPRALRVRLEDVRLAIWQQKLEQKKCLAASSFETKQRGLEAKQLELESELSLIIYPVLTLQPELVARIFVECPRLLQWIPMKRPSRV